MDMELFLPAVHHVDRQDSVTTAAFGEFRLVELFDTRLYILKSNSVIRFQSGSSPS